MSVGKHYNKVVIVDQHYCVIGAEDLLVAREQGLLRSGVRIFVLSQAGNILLQKRGAQALHPFELDISASGAVDEGETRLEAAKRELLEETSIAGVELQPVAEPFRSPGTINAVYSVIVPDKTSFIFDRSEVDDLLWVSLSELNELIADSNSACSPALRDTWAQLSDKIISTKL